MSVRGAYEVPLQTHFRFQWGGQKRQEAKLSEHEGGELPGTQYSFPLFGAVTMLQGQHRFKTLHCGKQRMSHDFFFFLVSFQRHNIHLYSKVWNELLQQLHCLNGVFSSPSAYYGSEITRGQIAISILIRFIMQAYWLVVKTLPAIESLLALWLKTILKITLNTYIENCDNVRFNTEQCLFCTSMVTMVIF